MTTTTTEARAGGHTAEPNGDGSRHNVVKSVATPGPWAYHNDEPDEYYPEYVSSPHDGGVVVARVQYLPERGSANARLIAAAPDLLAALQGMLAIADRYTGTGLAEVDAARAAIHNATH